MIIYKLKGRAMEEVRCKNLDPSYNGDMASAPILLFTHRLERDWYQALLLSSSKKLEKLSSAHLALPWLFLSSLSLRVWHPNQENFWQLSAIFVFISCFLIFIVPDKGISLKYWVFLNCLLYVFTYSSHCLFWHSFSPLLRVCVREREIAPCSSTAFIFSSVYNDWQHPTPSSIIFPLPLTRRLVFCDHKIHTHLVHFRQSRQISVKSFVRSA